MNNIELESNKKLNNIINKNEEQNTNCPSCGCPVSSFALNCPACGVEVNSSKTRLTVRDFSRKLEDIESLRPKENVLSSILTDNISVSETDQKCISLIRNFVIPNTKEDLYEFFLLAASNIDVKPTGVFEKTKSKSDIAVSDAWFAKFEQAYEKAKIFLGNTSEFKNIQDIYEKKINEKYMAEKKSKQNSLYLILFYISFFISIFLLVGGLILITK